MVDGKVSGREFFEFLATISKRECIVCGNNRLSVITDESGRANSYALFSKELGTPVDVALGVISLVCGSCGFIRYHDTSIVLRQMGTNDP